MDPHQLSAFLSDVFALLQNISAEQFGIAAVIVHAYTYSIYIAKLLRRKIEPTVITWVLWAGGTIVVAWAERDLGAQGFQLYLLYVCAPASIIVAGISAYLGGWKAWLVEKEDRTILTIDCCLIATYFAAYYAYKYGVIGETERYVALVVLLLALNVSTLVTFRPMIRDARLNPDREHSLAWSLWTLAYVLLSAATLKGLQEQGETDSVLIALFMVYPAVNAYLHGRMAWLARSTRHGGRRVTVVPS